MLRREYTPADVARFWAKVEKQPDGCWVWGACRDHGGYGMFKHGRTMGRAHRCAYEMVIGPIPDGLTLDHLCRNRTCVNPAHLEPVTREENMARGVAVRQTCAHGHPFDEANTYRTPSGRRCCRACNLEYVRRYRAIGRRPRKGQ